MGKVVTQNDDKNLYIWDVITTKYWDDAGTQLYSNSITYDDGSALELGFSSVGYLTSIITTDASSNEGKYDWSSKKIGFDQNGQISYDNIEYDNGTVESSSFRGGVVSTKSIWDSDYGSKESGSGGEYSWKLKTWQYYGENNSLSSVITEYDNGVLKAEEHGVSGWIKTSSYDAEDAFEWKVKKEYIADHDPDPNAIRTASLMDDGDIYFTLMYKNSLTYAQVHEDIDNSEEYYAKLEVYNSETGEFHVEYFDSLKELTDTHPAYEQDRPTFDEFNFSNEAMENTFF